MTWLRNRRASRFHRDIERSRIGSKSIYNSPGGRGAPVRGRAEAVKPSVYKHLLDVNAGFDQAIEGLAALRKNDAFVDRQLDRYIALVKETRAATNSYLVSVLEREETREAGRRFGKRPERELREE